MENFNTLLLLKVKSVLASKDFSILYNNEHKFFYNPLVRYEMFCYLTISINHETPETNFGGTFITFI